mgnify:CR=1 FL=1
MASERYTGNRLLENPLAAVQMGLIYVCLLYTSDAADERSSVDLGGRRIIKKKKNNGRTSLSSRVLYQDQKQCKVLDGDRRYT